TLWPCPATGQTTPRTFHPLLIAGRMLAPPPMTTVSASPRRRKYAAFNVISAAYPHREIAPVLYSRPSSESEIPSSYRRKAEARYSRILSGCQRAGRLLGI